MIIDLNIVLLTDSPSDGSGGLFCASISISVKYSILLGIVAKKVSTTLNEGAEEKLPRHSKCTHENNMNFSIISCKK